MGSFEGCSSEEQKFVDGQGNTKLLLSTTDPKKVRRTPRAARQNANLAMPNARLAARRHFPRSARSRARPARQIRPCLLARRHLEAFLRRDDPRPAKRSAPAPQRIFRAQFENGRRHAPRRSSVPCRHRHRSRRSTSSPASASTTNSPTSSKPASPRWKRCKPPPAIPPNSSAPSPPQGSIAKGKLADLVLLDADPLTDIHNTRKIAAVIANGHLYDRGALDTLLKNAEAAAAQNPKPTN